MITDLSLDLVEEILSKVSLTSLKAVKSTCKGWNTLSKDESFTKKHSAIEFPVFLTCKAYRFHRRFNLHRIHNIKDMPCIKDTGELHSPIGLYIESTSVTAYCYASMSVTGKGYLYGTRIWLKPDGLSSELIGP